MSVNPSVNTADNRLSTSDNYAFDNAGNTAGDAEGRTFVYDAENKQVSVSDTNGTIGEYSYDGDGKRIRKYVPGTGETTVFVYDAGGKLIQEHSTVVQPTQDAKTIYTTNDHLGSPRINTDATGQTYTYDAENKQIEAKNSGNYTIGRYYYDGDGKRIKKIAYDATGNETETTVFVYDAAGKQIAEYSTVVASSNDAEVAYLTSDHLGSPRINTDRDGNVTARHDYHPFGEEIVTSQRTTHAEYTPDTVRKQFTGYERDRETELDFAQARYFGSGLGRFSSPDDFVNDTSTADPQSWNLYVYVRNNPLVFIDPDGKTIWIWYEEKDSDGKTTRKFFQYKDGKLYTTDKDGKETEYTGDNQYALAVRDHLNALKSDDPFVALKVQTLEDSKFMHQITMTTPAIPNNGSGTEPDQNPNAQNGTGSGSVIFYNPFKDTDPAGDRRHPRVALAHEISHSFDYDQGEDSRRTNSQGIEVVEIRATQLENRVRTKTGDAMRIERNGIPLSPYDIERRRTFSDKMHKSWRPDSIRRVKTN